MECNHARLLIALAGRDCQELAPPDLRLLEEHLETCPDCAAAAHAEQQTDHLLSQAMRAVPVPLPLRAKILNAVARPARPRYWPWIAAACLLLALGLGGYWVFQPHAKLDMEQFAWNLDQHTKSGPEIVEAFFADEGLNSPAPRQFRYTYLEAINVQMIQGQKVGHLLFHFRGDSQHPPAVAHVYVLPARYVDLRAPVSDRIPTSTHTIEFLKQSGVERPEFIFMVVYTGTSLDPFLLRGHLHEA